MFTIYIGLQLFTQYNIILCKLVYQTSTLTAMYLQDWSGGLTKLFYAGLITDQTTPLFRRAPLPVIVISHIKDTTYQYPTQIIIVNKW